MAVDATVDLTPTVQIIASYLVPVAGALITAAITYLARQVQARTGFHIDEADLDRIKSAAKAEAGKMILASPTDLAGVALVKTSPEIQRAVSYIQSNEADTLKRLGLTPDWLADKVAGYLGEMQSNGAVVPVTMPTSTASSLAGSVIPPGKALS